MPALDLTAGDLGKIRFAISPMSQLIGALQVLGGKGIPVGLEEWRADRLARYEARCAVDPVLPALTELLVTTSYVPDCLSVPPRATTATIETELQMLRRTPTAQVRADLERSAAEQSGADATDLSELWNTRELSSLLADTLSDAWLHLVAPDWPTIKAILERDIQHRGGVLVTRGLAAALGDLDPALRWYPGGQLVRRNSATEPHQLDGAGLWLVPNAYGGGWLCLDGRGAFALTYAARGVAGVGRTVAQPAAALQELIGRSRAVVLSALERPATTSQLAGELRMSMGAVGDHLAVLRKNRLVIRTRAGRAVLYRRTALAEALVESS